MTALLRAFILRRIARHKLRTALAVVAVALGVAAFLSSVAVGRSIASAGTTAVAQVGGGADLVVTSEETGLSPSLAQDIAAVPGVKAASGIAYQWIRSPDVAAGRVLVLAADPGAEMRMRRRTAQGTAAPPWIVAANGSSRPAVSIDFGAPGAFSQPLLDELAAAGKGATIRLRAAGGEVKFTSFAAIDVPDRARSLGGGRFVAIPLSFSARLFGRDGRVDRIDVTLADGEDPSAAALRIAAALVGKAPSAVHVAPPGSADPSTRDMLGAAEVGLRLGAVVALLVGIFLIHHTVSIGVTERRREVGILRALGATRGQILVGFCGEAALLGAVGAALGIAIGWGLAQGALNAFAATLSLTYLPAEPAPVEITWQLALSGAAAGVVTALVAAWTPAWRAATVAPDDAIRRGPEDTAASRAASGPRIVASLALTAVAAAFIVLPLGKHAGYVASIALLGAFVVAAPMLLSGFAKLLGPLLTRVGGVPGRIASDELLRHANRAALPAAALAFGLALVVENVGVVSSLREGTAQWMEENVAGDLFVSSGSVALSAGGHSHLDASLRHEIAKVPGVREALGVRVLRVPWQDTRIMLIAVDIAGYRRMAKLSIRAEEPRDAVLAKLETGECCILSENFEALHGVTIGDDVEIPATRGSVKLRVAGIFPDYSWPRGTVFLDRGLIERELHDASADEFSVALDAGADPKAVGRAIEERIGTGRALVVTTAAEFRDAARKLFDEFFGLAYAQAAVSLAVAFLGVLNSLWIAVLLRQRELALFRAAGATQRQVIASIALQAGAMGLAGGLFGVAGGIAIEWIALRRVILADTGWATRFEVPWAACAAVVVAGVVVSVLAAVFPARAAARRALRESLGWE